MWKSFSFPSNWSAKDVTELVKTLDQTVEQHQKELDARLSIVEREYKARLAQLKAQHEKELDGARSYHTIRRMAWLRRLEFAVLMAVFLTALSLIFVGLNRDYGWYVFYGLIILGGLLAHVKRE